MLVKRYKSRAKRAKADGCDHRKINTMLVSELAHACHDTLPELIAVKLGIAVNGRSEIPLCVHSIIRPAYGVKCNALDTAGSHVKAQDIFFLAIIHHLYPSTENADGYPGDICYKKQGDKRCDKEWNTGLSHLRERQSRDTAGGIEVCADRRRDKTNGNIHDHDHAQVYRIDIQRKCNRQQDRNENVVCGVAVNKHACNEEEDIDDKQEQELAVADKAEQEVGRCGAYASNGKGLGKEVRAHNDEHDDRRLLCRGHKHLAHLFPLHIAVH